MVSSQSIRVLVGYYLLATVRCKVYDRCELARELYDLHEIPIKQVPTWVCLARHESEFNTSAINLASGDHGLFQISELFWCSPPGYACGISCNDLHDDNIEDDVICARRVYREHRRLSGDGFNAWVVYNQYCRDKEYVNKMVEGCFDGYVKGAELDEDIEIEKPLPAINYYPQFTPVKVKTTTTEIPTTQKHIKTTQRYVKTTQQILKTTQQTIKSTQTNIKTTHGTSKTTYKYITKAPILKVTQAAKLSTSIVKPFSKSTFKPYEKPTTLKTNKIQSDNEITTNTHIYSIGKTGFKIVKST